MKNSRKLVAAGAAIITLGAVVGVSALPPKWWEDRVGIQGEEKPNSPATIGQLKNMAHHLHAEMEANLPGGAGFALVDLFPEDPPSAERTEQWKAEQHKVANIGQLKHVSYKFYERLNAFAPSWISAQFEANGLTAASWPYGYPWDVNAQPEVNTKPVTLGQLKLVFSLRVGDDEDGNKIPDILDQVYYNSLDPETEDHDGDGLSDADEFRVHNSSPFLLDSDFDEMPDAWEVEQGFAPGDASDAEGDPDQDSLVNAVEYAIDTNPLDRDSDNDDVPDGVEYNQ